MFNRSRQNLACWFTLFMGSIVVIFASLIYYVEAVDQLETTDRLLYKKARVMAASVKHQFYKNQKQVNLENVPLLGNNPEPLDSSVTYARWYNERGFLVRLRPKSCKKSQNLKQLSTQQITTIGCIK